MDHNHTERTPDMILLREPSGRAREVKIPETVLVACPIKEFKLRAAARCETCGDFKGLKDRLDGAVSDIGFASRYHVICVHPMSRQLHDLDIAAD